MKAPISQVYHRTGINRVLCIGYTCSDANACRSYFGSRVAVRLKEGDTSEFLQNYLEKMPDTGFSLTCLHAEATQSRQPRDWEVGEAFVEVVLEDNFDCLFPWPTARDQREKEGHATGPDLPGYHIPAGATARFTFGEVKSSEQKKSPPAVVLGVDARAGNETLVGQLRRLLTEPVRRQNLIAWLGFREAGGAQTTGRFDAAFNDTVRPATALLLDASSVGSGLKVRRI